MATTITCHATACKHNSSRYCNSDTGACLKKDINFTLDEDDNYTCGAFEWDKVKHYMSNSELKEYRETLV